jgi:protein required for attachment to host cells
MPGRTTWILVADGERARIFENDGSDRTLQRAIGADLVDPNPPTHVQGADRPGRVHASVGPGRSAMGDTDWHQYEKQVFAREIAHRLDDARKHNAFDRLIVVAPPRVLGDLRQSMDDSTAKLVAVEIDKDLTHDAPHQLEARLAEHL